MHNSWATHAQQLLCMRISAVMQAHNSCCAAEDTDCLNNFSNLFQQLQLPLSATYPISSNNMTYLFQQHDLSLSTTRRRVCHKSIARILLGCIELDDGKETLQSQLPERRQEIIRKKLEAWCADEGFRDTTLNMVTLSRSLDIPKPELSKYFSGLNTTFRFWLAEVRFEAAKKMILEKPNYSNDMISAECGFSSRSNLYRMFKEKEGCSPTAWREKNC